MSFRATALSQPLPNAIMIASSAMLATIQESRLSIEGAMGVCIRTVRWRYGKRGGSLPQRR
jgi:hypothetical protein